jgi:type I restriction enzyme S subunit
MSDLPKNWEHGKLSQTAHVVRGITFPAGEKRNDLAQGYVCCLRTTNVQQKLEWHDVYYVPTSYVKRDEQLVREGDVLMSMANSYELVGKVARAINVPQPAAFGAFLAAVRPTHAIDGGYLYHFLRSSEVQSKLREGSSQTTNIANISVGRLSELPVPLAPWNEQKRIADKLDTVLARVDAVNIRLARVAPLLKRFRQSVLAAATSGRLTEDWRLINGVSDPQALTLGQLIKVSSGDGLTAKEMKPEGGVPVYGGNGINGYHNQSNVSEPTIVIGRVGFYCGSVHLTPSTAWVTDNALRVKFDPAKLDRKYLYFALQGTDLRLNMSSTAQPVISGQKIYPLSFNLPTLPDQIEIVRRVETLFAFADRLEARLQTVQTAADRLTPSLLAKAFRGELVPQDPNDEPASELLKRLAASAPVSPTRRGRSRASKVD